MNRGPPRPNSYPRDDLGRRLPPVPDAAMADKMLRAADALRKLSQRFPARRRGKMTDWDRAITALAQGAAWYRGQAPALPTPSVDDSEVERTNE